MSGEHRTDKSNKVFASVMNAEAVTPSDTGSHLFNALWIGGAGSGGLKVDTAGGDTVTFAGVPVGWFPVAVTRVYSTDTNVTNIVGVNW